MSFILPYTGIFVFFFFWWCFGVFYTLTCFVDCLLVSYSSSHISWCKIFYSYWNLMLEVLWLHHSFLCHWHSRFLFRNSLFNLKVRRLFPVCLWRSCGFAMLTLVKTLPHAVALHYQVSWGQFLLMAAVFHKALLMINYSTIIRGNSIRFLCIHSHYNFVNWSLHNLVLSVLLFEGILLIYVDLSTLHLWPKAQ